MDTSLQGANLTLDERQQSLEVQEQQETLEAEKHIHLPKPSLWPLILSAAIMVTVGGMLGFPDSALLTYIGAPLILVGILGWALEDPMGGSHAAPAVQQAPITSKEAREILKHAREIAQHMVTVSSTAYSTHLAKVELEGESEDGVTLALYGKVELETQRSEIEAAIRELPGVKAVHNFMIAEDAILRQAYAKLDALRAKGKLDGASNISILVENYILHLYGDVPNRDMKYALEREMVGITGVKVVVNHIGLNKDIPGNLGKTRNA
uniref:BON domain-containing protein n=1 Tax=Thermosporothrix sp. COM3 TaxID=2490863 RepID=A0A455SZ38_9CHLR|nr:hypothetical protein KTC_51650 [Thermosporothrix sp. COM3]